MGLLHAGADDMLRGGTRSPTQTKEKSGSAFISRILFSPVLADRERGHLSGGSCDPAPACAGCDYYPESYSLARERAGRPSSCYVLHRMGFVVPPSLLSERWALTPPFHPYPRLFFRNAAGGLFSVTLSVAPGFRPAPPRILRGMLPEGVRTFLCWARAPQRSSVSRGDIRGAAGGWQEGMPGREREARAAPSSLSDFPSMT